MVQAASQISFGASVTVIFPQPSSINPKVLSGVCAGWDTSSGHILVRFDDASYETCYVPISQIQ